MNEILQQIQTSITGFLPEVTLFIGLIGITLWISFVKKPTPKKSFNKVLWVTIVIVIIALVLAYQRWDHFESDQVSFLGALTFSRTATLFHCFILVASLLSLLHIAVIKYRSSAEYFALFLAIVFGALVLSTSSNFMSMFVSLELISICSYTLIAIERKIKNFESSIKYLTVGAIISAIMLYGMSMIYGFTGTLAFSGIMEHANQPAFYIVLLMVMAGLLFKLTATPFHTWAPDVYETAPLPVLSFLSVVPKIAAFLVILKLVSINSTELTQVLSVIVLISIGIGNFAALRQKDAKRMMAYSGIAQAGFIMIGLLNSNGGGTEASLFYLSVYIFMNVGAFLLIDLLEKTSGSSLLESFAGLGTKKVLLGVITILIMISLVGIPPSGGFTAKFLVFSALIPMLQEGQSLALIVLVFGVLNTAISLFYYLRIPYFMFIKENPEAKIHSKETSKVALVFLTSLGLTVLYLFFNPGLILNLF